MGQPANLEAKAKGDNRMLVKQETNRRRLGRRLARPARYGEKLHCFNLSSQRCNRPSSHDNAYGESRWYMAGGSRPSEPSDRRAVENDSTQGSERGTYVALLRLAPRNAGSPTGRES